MPRKARLDVPGALHHTMIRGINKSVIFPEDEERSRFLHCLDENVTKAGASIYAWILMDTHVRLLFKNANREFPQSCVNFSLGTAILQTTSYKYRTSFRKPLKTILCDEDNYSLPLVRYIHQNPERMNS